MQSRTADGSGWARFRLLATTGAVAASVALAAGTANAQEKSFEERMDMARKWVEEEFQPSTLSKEEQMEEMEWFIKAAEEFRGMDINVVSETIATHEYESETMAKAFSEITGINLTHELIQEGDVIEKLQTQMYSGENIYDAYVNDSDLIGTHYRYNEVVPLSDWMKGEGKDVTLPTLDIDDFMGKSFTTGPDGKMYQLPDQQFANLYWFRYDWFQREDLQKRFKDRYGYELGVPVNWSAYEDIAEFFTEHVEARSTAKDLRPHGLRQEGPVARLALHRRLAVDGRGRRQGPAERQAGRRVGHPGRRLPPGGLQRRPRRRHQRAGQRLRPAQVHRVAEDKYAPPQASGMTFSEAGPVPAQGQVAQQIFWYTAFTASMAKPDLPVTDEDGNPKWRMAPSPHGPTGKRA